VKRFLILGLVLAGSAIGYSSLSVPARERLAGLFSLDYEIPVEVVKAYKQTLGRTIAARGELQALKEVRVNATVSGIIKEIRFDPGAKVTAGAVVAVIESQNLSERLEIQEAAVKEAEAQVKKHEKQLAAAEKQLTAARDLFEKRFIARREVEIAEAAAATARMQKEAAEAHLAQRLSVSAQIRHVLALARVTAPITGLVSRQWVEPGARVAEAAPIVSISQSETLKILVNLKSRDTETMRPGTIVQVVADALPDRVFRGRVTQIQELANFTGDESSVEIETANPSGVLKIGMAASVSLPLDDRHEGIFVPRGALVQTQGIESYVFVLQSGKARQRTVTCGKEYDSRMEIVSGLEVGEVVVVKGVERLRDGSRVLPVQ
jgi:membrane fusion protein (multidrug efflux system)